MVYIRRRYILDEMNKKDIIKTVLALLGPILRLLAKVLEPRSPTVAQYLRSAGTATDITAYALIRV